VQAHLPLQLVAQMRNAVWREDIQPWEVHIEACHQRGVETVVPRLAVNSVQIRRAVKRVCGCWRV